MTEPILLNLSRYEVLHLISLLREFGRRADLASGPERLEGLGLENLGLERLAPAVYPDDFEASAEFSRLTQGDLWRGHASQAQTMERMLTACLADASYEPAKPDSDMPVAIEITAEQLDGWLQTLAGIRLMLASIVGVDEDGESDPTDPRSALYQWLGFVLEQVIQAADAADGITPSTGLEDYW